MAFLGRANRCVYPENSRCCSFWLEECCKEIHSQLHFYSAPVESYVIVSHDEEFSEEHYWVQVRYKRWGRTSGFSCVLFWG